MKKQVCNITLSLIASAALCSLNAYEMKPIGFKAVGMGGAGVASSRGALASYYNPALVGLSDYTAEITLNGGFALRENKLIETADELNSLDFSDSFDAIDEITSTNYESMTDEQQTALDKVEQAREIIHKIPKGNGLELSPNVSLAAQFSNYFAFGFYGSLDLRAYMDISDKKDLIFKIGDDDSAEYFEYSNGTVNTDVSEITYQNNSLQYAVENDETSIAVNAMALAEVPLSFAYPIERENGLLSLGISIKPMAVQTFSTNMALDSESDELSDDYEENKKEYTSLGVDLGFAYREKNTGLVLGLIGKNINKPTFETEPNPQTGEKETFELDSFFRAGLSLPVWNDNIEFAIDADLQQSDTNYEGMKSQYVGGGFELHPASWFALRAGAMKNIATESIDEGFIYTAGLGFGLKWLQFDLSVQMAEKTAMYDGEEIPKYVAANFSLVSRWGDGYRLKVPQSDINSNVPQPDIIRSNSSSKDQLEKKAEDAHKELDEEVGENI